MTYRQDIMMTRRVALLALVLFWIAAFAAPAQTGQHSVGSYAGEIVSFRHIIEERRQVRRVNADVCLTEARLRSELADMGFQSISLGVNVAALDMMAQARFGASWFALRLDRCNGRLRNATMIPEFNLERG